MDYDNIAHAIEVELLSYGVDLQDLVSYLRTEADEIERMMEEE